MDGDYIDITTHTVKMVCPIEPCPTHLTVHVTAVEQLKEHACAKHSNVGLVRACEFRECWRVSTSDSQDERWNGRHTCDDHKWW